MIRSSIDFEYELTGVSMASSNSLIYLQGSAQTLETTYSYVCVVNTDEYKSVLA